VPVRKCGVGSAGDAVLGAGRWHDLSLQGYIYTTPPPSYSYCPPPLYTITHSAGHPPFLPSLTIILSYFPTLTVHLLPILSLPQLDTLEALGVHSVAESPGLLH
jgi:hypothetical protein